MEFYAHEGVYPFVRNLKGCISKFLYSVLGIHTWKSKSLNRETTRKVDNRLVQDNLKQGLSIITFCRQGQFYCPQGQL